MLTLAAIPAYNERMNKNPCIDGHQSQAYWKYDARGIPLAKICKVCAAWKLAKYRPEVLTNSNYYADESVDGE